MSFAVELIELFGGSDWVDGMIREGRKREVGTGANWRGSSHQGDCGCMIYTALRESATH